MRGTVIFCDDDLTLPLQNLGFVASLLAAILYHGNLKRRHHTADLIRLMGSHPPQLADLTQLIGTHPPALADLTRLMGPHSPTLAELTQLMGFRR
jgi:hypothetical protein